MIAVTKQKAETLDAATTEVIRHYIVSAAREMERTLVRTAYSTIIYEINDFGLSIFDRKLRLLGDSTGLSVFLGANEYAVLKCQDMGLFDDLAPGDVLMMSIPYVTGTHTNDAILVQGAQFLGGGGVVHAPRVQDPLQPVSEHLRLNKQQLVYLGRDALFGG